MLKHPPDNDVLEYIFFYCQRFMTRQETLANQNFFVASKSYGNGAFKEFLKHRGIGTEEKDVLELMKDGFEIYKQKVAERIYTEHYDELKLNLCPKCKRIARTPWAKQCRYCGYDWHNIQKHKT